MIAEINQAAYLSTEALGHANRAVGTVRPDDALIPRRAHMPLRPQAWGLRRGFIPWVCPDGLAGSVDVSKAYEPTLLCP